MIEGTLPAAFVELQKTHPIDPEEQAKLLRYIDEFEQLREEYMQTQGYGWTRKSEGTLWQRLNTTMLKATYIPKDTQELLDLPSQLSDSFGLLDAYDPVYQICWCIKYQGRCGAAPASRDGGSATTCE